jgi:hypothetical protein
VGHRVTETFQLVICHLQLVHVLFQSPVELLDARVVLLAIRRIPHHTQHQLVPAGLERAQQDVHGKFAAILPPSPQFQSLPHRPGAGGVLLAMARMRAPETLRHKDLNRLADQFFTRVPEKVLRLRIHLHDSPLAIHSRNGVWGKFKHTLIHGLGRR